jgi:hypothetical protein
MIRMLARKDNDPDGSNVHPNCEDNRTCADVIELSEIIASGIYND